MECKHLFGLTSIFLLYLCIGAVIFQATESGHEQETITTMVEQYRQFVDEHSCIDAHELGNFIREIVEKIGPYGGLARIKFNLNMTQSLSRPRWDFAGAFTFCVNAITTIGYGDMLPVSPFGRLLCVTYALFGIPLTLIVLSGIGEQLNKIGRKIMSLKLCFESQNVNKALNMVGVVLAGIVVMFVIPTIVFVLVEEWNILQGLYYCFITLSTIGFGDYVAGTGDNIENETSRNIYRIVVYLWVLIGLAYISLIVKSLSDLFIKKAEQVKEEAKKRVADSRLTSDLRSMTLATITTVSNIAGVPYDGPQNSDSEDEQSGVHNGPTMTYRKHGLTRLMATGKVAENHTDVQLVSVNFKGKGGQASDGKREDSGDFQENNNSVIKGNSSNGKDSVKAPAKDKTPC